MSSYSPAAMLVKPFMVSAIETYLPGEPVNCSATKNGCERKRWILRAREPVAVQAT